MASFFEPEPFLFDPTSYHDDSPSSFLSFASFADLSSIKSPFSLSSWGHDLWEEPTKHHPLSSASNTSDSVTSSPPSDPFSIIEAAFEPSTPYGDIGIFVDNPASSSSQAGPSSKIYSASDNQSSSSTATFSYRSGSSSDSWDTPHTPGLSNKASTESFASSHTGPYSPSPFSWDEASTSTFGASSSYQPAPYTQAVHRTTSNPTLSSASRPRVPKPMASMPSLKEEEQQTPSAWFDGTDFGSFDVLTTQANNLGQGISNLEVTDDALADDFDWVFGDYGLGMAGDSTDSAQNENNMYSYQAEEQQPVASTSNSIPVIQTSSDTDTIDTNWLRSGALMQDIEIPPYDFSSIANMPSFTIDPMAVMAPNAGLEQEEPSRPSSAPGFNEAKGSGPMLSVPMADTMMRSISSDGFVHQRHAPPRDLFSYTPQRIPSGPPGPQPLYTTEPSPSFQNYPRAMPPTPSHSHHRRMSFQSQGLSVQIHPPAYSTYMQQPLPTPPHSATFGDPFICSQSQGPQPITMTRAGTQPLPMTRKLSSGVEPSSLPDTSNMPAHLVRAQAIVQMQEAKEEAQRQEMRRQAAGRRVGMAQSSVMQPQYPQPPRHQTIMGWEGPSAQTASLPVLTTTPLVTIHPPPTQYSVHHGGMPTTPHRIHPPPHPGVSSRPIARLPSSPTKPRKVSNSPAKRSPSGKKRQPMQPGGFSWGEATFINFTSEDAEKLLTGVAPSGSQSKRKREEEAMMGPIEMDRERSKRSRSDE